MTSPTHTSPEASGGGGNTPPSPAAPAPWPPVPLIAWVLMVCCGVAAIANAMKFPPI